MEISTYINNYFKYIQSKLSNEKNRVKKNEQDSFTFCLQDYDFRLRDTDWKSENGKIYFMKIKAEKWDSNSYVREDKL